MLDSQRSFQSIILALQNFWAKQGCAILQPYDVEMGAGTFHPATALRSIDPHPWRAAYVQPSRRPTDGRYGENPNRLGAYYQFQVIIKPTPENAQELYLESLKAIGVDTLINDIRFVEDDWESPTLGAAGLGWEVWCNGAEVSQFTYFQQMGGLPCSPISVELTYGLERLALVIQKKESIFDLNWNGLTGPDEITYKNVFFENERQFSHYAFEQANTDILFRQFQDAEQESRHLLDKNLPLPAYDQCLKASHLFNLLDARGMISVTERPSYIARVRDIAKACCQLWATSQGAKTAE